jgi:hypothetical protein
MSVDIEVDDRKSHVDRSLQMTGKGTGISPFLEELIVEMDPLFNLSKIGPPTHLSEKIPFVDFEGITFFKVGAILDGPDSKTELRESGTISIGEGEGNFPLHCYPPFNYRGSKPLGNSMVIALSTAPQD